MELSDYSKDLYTTDGKLKRHGISVSPETKEEVKRDILELYLMDPTNQMKEFARGTLFNGGYSSTINLLKYFLILADKTVSATYAIDVEEKAIAHILNRCVKSRIFTPEAMCNLRYDKRSLTTDEKVMLMKDEEDMDLVVEDNYIWKIL